LNININGDTFATLRRQAVELQRATDALQKALAEATPHGRNYQPTQAGYDGDRALHTNAYIALRVIKTFSDHFLTEVARNTPEDRNPQ
jgi:hypothetical protein